MNVIMARIAGDDGNNLSTEQIDEIGLELIRNYCSLQATSASLGMNVGRLKHLIKTSPELQVYFEIAHEGIKQLTDAEVIRKLQEGDDDTLKMVFGKMYAGRAKGGYNISELGTTGYQDPLGKRLAAETEQDRKKGNVQVQFNFITKDIRTDLAPVTVEGRIIDAEDLED